jgi:hypothetical protein
MPDNRPAIPLEVQRSIFVEAGHRCACCGVPFPLERAHIVPWSKSKDHSEENLLCLCANCHQIADKDWDRATFFAYKAKPWVNRQFNPVQSNSTADVTHESDVVTRYLATGKEVLNHLTELQLLLAQGNVDQAELVMQSLIDRARTLHALGVELRARIPKLATDDLAILDRVYETVASILNEKQGNIFTVAEAIGNAELHLKNMNT